MRIHSMRYMDPMEPLITSAELAAILRVSRSLVYAYAAQGRIPCIRLGSRVLFRPVDVERWMEGEIAEAAQRDVPPRPVLVCAPLPGRPGPVGEPRS